MNINKNIMKLYAVTDRRWTNENKCLLEQIEDALKGGVTCLQLREKDIAYNYFLKEAIQVKKICRKYNVPLIINDNIEIAIQSGADGVHLGQDDIDIKTARKILGENKIIGISAHNVKEALKAQQDGADYLGTGAIFGSSTKTNVSALSIQTLKEICNSVSIPVVAIGGINKNNIVLLEKTGISGTALVSAIFAAENIEKECKELLEIIEKITK